MARAHTIWVIVDQWGGIQGAFTVKHECQSYIELWYNKARDAGWMVAAIRDGGDVRVGHFSVAEFLDV